MNTILKISLTIMLFIGASNVNLLISQDQDSTASEQTLHMLAHQTENSVLLRWGPSDFMMWKEANKSGMLLQRARVPKLKSEFENYGYDPNFSKVIKPLVEDHDRWKNNIDADDYVTAAWVSLYEEKPEVIGNLAQMVKGQDELNQKAFFIGMLAADHSHMAAQLMGLGIEDGDVELGETYIYKISLVSDSSVYAQVLVDYTASKQNVRAFPLKTQPEDHAVLLSWSRDFDGGNFTSYIIERSDTPTGTFTSITNTPYLRIKSKQGTEESIAYHTDSIDVNYKPYYYRITGINPFGIKSKPSEVIMGMGVDLTPPVAPHNLIIEEQENKTLKLEWKKENRESDFAGFIVSRAEDYEGPYSSIHEGKLAFNVNEIIDEQVAVGTRYYYSVAALDTAGNVSTTLVNIAIISDNSPITTPVGLSGSIDSNGVVTIHWEKSKDPRVIGYKVYSSNSPNHRFLMKSGELIKDTSYSEKIALRTLSERILYKVAAVNVGYAYSELSDALELRRPDVVPPSFSVFTSKVVEDGVVKLVWAISHSHDLVEQQLLRKNTNEDWQILSRFDASIDRYEDNSLEPGVEYSYALRTVDDAGLLSEYSPIITASITNYIELDPVHKLQASFNKESKEIELKWDYPNPSDYEFLIYKAKGSNPIKAYDKVNSETKFVDRQLSADQSYSYGVRVISKSGIESGISKKLTVVTH
jgi:fibronectin type 3 domain-containing protein